MVGVLRRIEEGTTTARDVRAVGVWLAALMLVSWVLGFVAGKAVRR